MAVSIRLTYSWNLTVQLNNKELEEALLALGSDDDEVQRRLEEHTPTNSEMSKTDLDVCCSHRDCISVVLTICGGVVVEGFCVLH